MRLSSPVLHLAKEESAEHAEPAGTSTSSESSTSTIDHKYTYLFLLRVHESNNEVPEPFMLSDISVMFGKERHRRDAVSALTDEPDTVLIDKLEHVSEIIAILRRDPRMTGPFMLRTAEPMTWGALAQHITELDKPGLDNFMAGTYVSLKMLEFEL